MRATRSAMLRPSGPTALARRHWWTAQCSESTGTISAPGVRLATATTGPAAISDSLLARARRCPALRAARVTVSPAKPTTPLTTTSASPAMAARDSGPAWISTLVPAGRAASRSAARDASAMATTSGRNSATWAASCSTDVDAPRATIR